MAASPVPSPPLAGAEGVGRSPGRRFRRSWCGPAAILLGGGFGEDGRGGFGGPMGPLFGEAGGPGVHISGGPQAGPAQTWRGGGRRPPLAPGGGAYVDVPAAARSARPRGDGPAGLTSPVKPASNAHSGICPILPWYCGSMAK